MAIPLFVTRPVLEPLLPRIAERQRAVLESGRYILGPEVEAFEAELAAYLGVGHCVGVASGTDALTIALRALGAGPGREVVVPAVTFFATAAAVVNAGARPVLADVEEGTWCITASTVEAALSERTAALLPVHLFGNPAPVGELRELAAARRLAVLEDAAQAIGAKLDGKRAGTIGDASAFSFFPSKNLGGFGDGGAIATDNDELAAKARLLRAHGSADKTVHTEVGFNSRLDELQAAALRVLLPHLDEWTGARRRAADAYRQAGLGDLVELPVETRGGESCFHLFVVATERRDDLREALAGTGIESRSYYQLPLYRQPALAPFAPDRELPGAERYASRCLALPMGPALDGASVTEVVEAVRAALAGADGPVGGH